MTREEMQAHVGETNQYGQTIMGVVDGGLPHAREAQTMVDPLGDALMEIYRATADGKAKRAIGAAMYHVGEIATILAQYLDEHDPKAHDYGAECDED